MHLKDEDHSYGWRVYADSTDICIGTFVNEDEAQEYIGTCRLVNRQADLLTAAVNSLKGPPPPDTLWSHHDVGELCQQRMLELNTLRTALKLFRQQHRSMEAAIAVMLNDANTVPIMQSMRKEDNCDA